MGQVREEADYLVVLLGGQGADVFEAYRPAESLAGGYGLERIRLGGGDDVVRVGEYLFLCVADSADLAPRHGMRPDEFKVAPQQLLHLIDHAAFNARHIGEQSARTDKPLILLYPVDENMWIKGENYQIEFADIFAVRVGSAAAYPALFEGKSYRIGVAVDCADLVAAAAQRLGVAAADKAETDYQNFCISIKFHMTLTSVPRAARVVKKSG